MTQEEKAKAYDEALKQAKKELAACGSMDCDAARLIFRLFPQPHESEDERMYNKIIDYLLGRIDVMPSNINERKILVAWLEKQKEQKELPLMDGNADLYFDEWNQQKQNPTKRQCFEEGIRYAQRLQKEQKPLTAKEYQDKFDEMYGQYKPNLVEQKPAECGCINDESEYDKGYREGHRFGLKQTEEYMIGKTFKGLIPCWVNAPSELQPAHKYHGKNVVVMHENNGGFRCICIDDEKPVTFHLPEYTLFVEGWKKKPTWSKEDEMYLSQAIETLEHENYLVLADKLKSLRPSWKPFKDEERLINTSISFLKDFADKGYDNAVECIDWLKSKL